MRKKLTFEEYTEYLKMHAQKINISYEKQEIFYQVKAISGQDITKKEYNDLYKILEKIKVSKINKNVISGFKKIRKEEQSLVSKIKIKLYKDRSYENIISNCISTKQFAILFNTGLTLSIIIQIPIVSFILFKIYNIIVDSKTEPINMSIRLVTIIKRILRYYGQDLKPFLIGLIIILVINIILIALLIIFNTFKRKKNEKI